MSKRRAELGIAEAALLFAALGDQTRLELLRRLSEAGPASISALAANFAVSRQAITKHLQSLAIAGIIDRTTFGPGARMDAKPGPIRRRRRVVWR